MSDINVTIVAATNATTAILNSDVVSVSAGPGFVGGGATALLVEAGANITVSTAMGSFTVIGRDVPVQSVQGRTGTVVLTRADLTAAALSHTHSTADIVGITAIAALSSPVQSVQGKTGSVVLSVTDLTAAAAVHTHSSSDITDLTATIQQYGKVVSVNGQTGTVALTVTDLTAAAASHTHSYAAVSHTHSTSDIVNLTATIQQYGGGTSGGSVSSVNGQTGTVVLTSVNVSAASASHSHVAANVTDLTSVANVVSVNGKTGAVSLVASDLTAASATHSHGYVTSLNGSTGSVTLVAGANVTVTSSTAGFVISSSGAQGPAGPTGSFGDPQTIQAKTASYTLQLADVGTLLTFEATHTGTLVISIPSETSVSWIAGSHIDIARLGNAEVSVSSPSSVLATPSAALRATYSGATLVYLGAGQWLMVGDLA